MNRPQGIVFQLSWIVLAVIGVAIFLFGLILSIWPGSNNPSAFRAIGVASIGMGLFGLVIALIPYRRGERWAWFTLWYYPVFWAAHFLGNLPPGQDHIHQVVFIALSLAALLLSARSFVPRGTS
jgi:uncharacterized membrane protein HdeD (DUF308 family)